jgi:hypothetical protein
LEIKMKKAFLALAPLATALTLSAPVQAAVVPLQPDTTSTNLNYTRTTSNNLFSIITSTTGLKGIADNYDRDGHGQGVNAVAFDSPAYGGLNLTAHVSSVGALLDGTLTLTGKITSLGLSANTTFLTGIVTSISAVSNGTTGSMLIKFLVTGGTAAGDYGQAGVVTTSASIPFTNWATNFSATNQAVDTIGGQVPEPGTLSILAAGLMGWRLNRRKSNLAVNAA